MKSECKINQIGKFRNGKAKYWCSTHYSMALVIGSERPQKCERADQPPVKENDRFYLKPEDWEGGIGIWGSLDPVYNTSKWAGHELGIHVHTREDESSPDKQIDQTFQEVYIKSPNVDLFGEAKNIKLNAEIACAYTASMVFNKKMKYLICSHCREPHVDADYYAVTYHKKHMCTYCGRDFVDTDIGISNPVVEIQRIFHSEVANRTINLVDREIDIKQEEYPGGIEIWGSNPAIIWTAKREEEAGIHIHLYKAKENQKPTIDETYGKVIIDGIELNARHIRCFMVQQSLTHLKDKVMAIQCPQCDEFHFDSQDLGVQPHENHSCEFCKHEFITNESCVANPIVHKLEKLKRNFQLLQK